MKFSLWNLKDWFEQRNIDLSYTISKGNTGISNIVLDEFQSPGTTADAVVLPAERISGCYKSFSICGKKKHTLHHFLSRG